MKRAPWPDHIERLSLPWDADDYRVWRIGYDERFYPRGDLPAFLEWSIPDVEGHPDSDYHPPWALWQEGRCAICGNLPRASSLHRDHDHDTGLIRGYLCVRCNTREGSSWEPVFKLWRAGMNPCAMFGWDYLWQGQHYMKQLEPDEVRALTRAALARHLAMPVKMREAMQKVGDLLFGSSGGGDDAA